MTKVLSNWNELIMGTKDTEANIGDQSKVRLGLVIVIITALCSAFGVAAAHIAWAASMQAKVDTLLLQTRDVVVQTANLDKDGNDIRRRLDLLEKVGSDKVREVERRVADIERRAIKP